MLISLVRQSFGNLNFLLFILVFGYVAALSLTVSASVDIDDDGYRAPAPTESEFDNVRALSAPPLPEEVVSGEEEYQDTEFGDYLYSEASLASKLEMLRLLSKQTPGTQVFLHALSMGVGIDDMLRASANYSPSNSRDLLRAAVSVLPLVETVPRYRYSGYELEDLDRRTDQEKKLDDRDPIYFMTDVIDRFFEDRLVLRPQPDWLSGEVHFQASAQEMRTLLSERPDLFSDNLDPAWYFESESVFKQPDANRPIFISLYEIDQTLRTDGLKRFADALSEDPNSKVPVVFVFNKLNEVAIDQVAAKEYPLTVRGVRDAYIGKDNLMLTPVPEWDIGEYHIQAELSELDDVFNLPIEEDFEPEYWQKLLTAARQYSLDDTSFLVTVLPSANKDDEDEDEENQSNNAAFSIESSIDPLLQLASWDNPRSEEAFPYVKPGSGDGEDENENDEQDRESRSSSYISNGLILNRPDLVAALLHLHVSGELEKSTVPVAFYYVDPNRVKTFRRGRAALEGYINGVPGRPPGGGNGGFGPPPGDPPSCASPPCVNN